MFDIRKLEFRWLSYGTVDNMFIHFGTTPTCDRWIRCHIMYRANKALHGKTEIVAVVSF